MTHKPHKELSAKMPNRAHIGRTPSSTTQATIPTKNVRTGRSRRQFMDGTISRAESR